MCAQKTVFVCGASHGITRDDVEANVVCCIHSLLVAYKKTITMFSISGVTSVSFYSLIKGAAVGERGGIRCSAVLLYVVQYFSLVPGIRPRE